MKIVQEARKYNGNASAWHRVIARSGPTYQAFDFTASFHSRSRIDSTTQSTALVDFGPYGSERYRTEDLDILSICFADDMAHNAKCFKHGHKWHPYLYEELKRRNRGVVSSKLDNSTGKGGN
ncbi:hypothetical protein GTA08_BOTSDO06870 [Botryosphaeria dothidea]|uniref:Uncharacterized protein n=1 Tax=Botryosphaeria dothidea TaxID=55169 RepID=A0A8H4IHX8_9PEZI|nr:hypothetical protein GTA08_BOTSDO11065 [Botryosphaeria dothidea]KAF4304876.1 hypothetical protein GTA08_BOTSDO06870 [Botryosphaeria dothidea]